MTDDTIVEATETVVATITGVTYTSGTLAFDSTPATISVDDNDSALVSIAATTQGSEGNPSAPVNPVFTVNIDEAVIIGNDRLLRSEWLCFGTW